VVYEDEGQEEMGDSLPHTTTEFILRLGLTAHLATRSGYSVLPNMNLYYHPTDRWAYVSPDVMVVSGQVPRNLSSYRIGETGPAPILVAEVLSRRTFQQGDLSFKPGLYADLGIPEYLLIDVTGAFMPERLLLKTLNSDRTWINHRDQGDGVDSRLGFCAVIEGDGDLRIVDAATAHRYARPDELVAVDARVRELEAELARLRGTPPTEK
jgi:hypothetical protein